MAGLSYEQFEVGSTIEHRLRRTIGEGDNTLFCSLTMNTQPLHLDEHWAKDSHFGQRVVNGLLTLALSVGMSVPETTEGTLIANLGYDEVRHPKPVFHGDTIGVRTEVVSKRRTSKPGRGLVVLRHHVFNQDDEEVCTYTRTVLVQVADPTAED